MKNATIAIIGKSTEVEQDLIILIPTMHITF